MVVEDIPKLYTALAEWLACVTILIIHRKRLDKNDILRVTLTLICSLGLLCGIQLFCGKVSGILWLVGMLVAVLVMMVTIWIALRTSRLEALYNTAGAFIWAEFAAALGWQIETFYATKYMNYTKIYSICFCVIMLVLTYAAFYIAERLAWKDSLERYFINISTGDILGVWLSTLVFFVISNLSYIAIQSPFSGTTLPEIFNIRTLVDLAGIIMLELFHIQKAESDSRREIDTIKRTLYIQYIQYRQSRENMELINQKYHDLKHQLQVIRAEEDNQKRLGYIDELEQNISFYDAQIETGNYVLDTILTEKSRQCLKQDITMTVVADGSLLNFMHVMDIATIFGNALDNAIEHEVLIEDKDMRMIHVTISQHDALIHVIIENKFSGKLRSEGKRILTTKHDERFHGYGLKSIRYTIEKYDGFMSAGVEDGWFKLKMVLPKK